jgi:hypothetical protein
MATFDKKRIRTPTLIIFGIFAAIGLYILFSSWRPFWKYSPGYISQAQFGADWPFTVPEARVICIGQTDMLLETRAGVFGITSHAIAIGYPSLDEAAIWKYDPNGWKHRVPADRFWIHVNTLCK